MQESLNLELDANSCHPPGLRWVRKGASTEHARHFLHERDEYLGWLVRHCGHPTANWPYYIVEESTGVAWVSHNGRGFNDVRSAKWSAEKLYEKHPQAYEFDVFPRIKAKRRDNKNWHDGVLKYMGASKFTKS